MRSDIVGDGESGSEIALEVLHFLDLLDQLGVDIFLNALELGSPLAFGLLAFLNLLLSVFGGILELILGVSASTLEERVVNVTSDTLYGNLLGSGNHVGRIHSPQRDSIDGIRSSDQKVAGSKSFKNDNSSASADAGEEDDDGSRGDGLSALSCLGLLAGSFNIILLVVSGVPGVSLVSESSLRGSTES